MMAGYGSQDRGENGERSPRPPLLQKLGRFSLRRQSNEREVVPTVADLADNSASPPRPREWSEALEAVLEPGAGAVRLTAEQSLTLAELYEWLLRQPEPDDGKRVSFARAASLPAARARTLSQHAIHRRYCCVPTSILDRADAGDASAAYLAVEFGGTRVRSTADLVAKFKAGVRAQMFINRLHSSVESLQGDGGESDPSQYAPSEWHRLDGGTKRRLRKMLSWESLSSWDFNIFDLANACGGSPLLFVGWAILGSPHAQEAMADDPAVKGDGSGGGGRGLSENGSDGDGDAGWAQAALGLELGGYDFIHEFSVKPRTICNFLRSIEADYDPMNPYHNPTHAADVVQSTHALLAMGGDAYVSKPLESYSLLLAAVVHDVGHPGQNNSYQIKAQTDHAITYNDKSVLENMHLCKAFGRLMGEHREESLDVLRGLDEEQLEKARTDIIAAVLETDNARHFDSLNKIEEGIALRPGDNTNGGAIDPKRWLKEEEGEPARQVLRLILHMADISAQSKRAPLFIWWSDRVYEEFFAQGDLEVRKGLPVSFLCDRKTTKKAKSQVGFVQFVVKPAFEVLGQLIPRVDEEVVPILEENLAYWKQKGKEEDLEQPEKK